MATTFIEAKALLDQIAEQVNTAKQRQAQARALLRQAQSTLAGMPAQYATFITDIDAAALADDWPQADSQKAEKDQMVTEFQALKNQIDAEIATIDAV